MAATDGRRGIKLKLKGLPNNVTEPEIEGYFYSREGELEDVSVTNLIASEGTATVELFGLKDAEGLIKQHRHRLRRDKFFSVQPYIHVQHQQQAPILLQVTVVNGKYINEEIVKQYLESPQSGGGTKKQVLDIKTGTRNAEYLAVITNIEDCNEIINKSQGHSVNEAELKILPVISSSLSTDSSASYGGLFSTLNDPSLLTGFNTIPSTTSLIDQNYTHLAMANRTIHSQIQPVHSSASNLLSSTATSLSSDLIGLDPLFGSDNSHSNPAICSTSSNLVFSSTTTSSLSNPFQISSPLVIATTAKTDMNPFQATCGSPVVSTGTTATTDMSSLNPFQNNSQPLVCTTADSFNISPTTALASSQAFLNPGLVDSSSHLPTASLPPSHIHVPGSDSTAHTFLASPSYRPAAVVFNPRQSSPQIQPPAAAFDTGVGHYPPSVAKINPNFLNQPTGFSTGFSQTQASGSVPFQSHPPYATALAGTTPTTVAVNSQLLPPAGSIKHDSGGGSFTPGSAASYSHALPPGFSHVSQASFFQPHGTGFTTAFGAPTQSVDFSAASSMHSLTASLPGNFQSVPIDSSFNTSVSNYSLRSPGEFLSSASVPTDKANENSESDSDCYYSDNCLILSNISPDDNEAILSMIIENNLSLEEDDFKLESCHDGFRLMLSEKHTQQELVEMCELLKEANLFAHRCEESRRILVENVKEGFKKKTAIQLYFEKHDRSGGGPIETIEEIHGGNGYIVTFKSHKVALGVLDKTHYKRLGPDVKITLIDPFQTHKPMEQCSNTKKIMVTGITDKKFQNLKALKNYFESARQSGGGEPVIVEYLNGNAMITYKNLTVVETVMKRKHSKLGSNVQMTLVDDSALLVPQDPISFQVNPLVAEYLKKKPEAVHSALSHLEVKFVIEDDILVTPTSSSLPDWQPMCKDILSTLTTQKIVVVSISILKEAREEIFPMVMIECQKNDLQFHFDSSESKMSLAGEATVVSSLEDKIKQMYDTVVKREEVYMFAMTESFIFFETCQLAEVSLQYPKLTLTLDHGKQSLHFFGCIRDLIKLKEQLPELCKHSKIFIPLQQLELKFISRVSFAEITSGQPKIPITPFLKMSPTGAAEGYYLLCPFQYTKTAESIGRSIKEKLNVKSYRLPKSFETNIIDNPEFQLLVQKLEREHKYEYDIQGDKLVVVGISSSAVEVSKAIISYVREKCAVTRDIHLIKGVWRLLNFKMKPTLAKCLDDIQDLGIQIDQPKPTSSDPIIKLKGEPDEVDIAAEYVTKMQSSVCQGRLPCERPGISKFFMDVQGQHILKGIEAQTGVCIEMGTANIKKMSPVEESSNQYIHVCSGTTTEFKAVHVYIGDITLFNRADVIVNAANESLKHAGGVALAIAKRGGPDIQKESDEYIKRRGEVIHTGSAILIPNAGNLPPSYKAIVHAVGPKWQSDHTKEVALLKRCCKRALFVAKSYGSIAIPAISCGMYGFPADVCADTLLKAVVEFSSNEAGAYLNSINFIIMKENANHFLQAAKRNFRDIFVPEKFKNAHAVHMPPQNLAAAEYEVNDKPSRTRRRRKQPTASQTLSKYQPSSLNKIKIINGSIIDAQVDAIVNTTDIKLGFGGAVATALLKAAGTTLRDECAKKAPVAFGSVTVTGAGKLHCKHILHVVLPTYDGPGGKAEQTLSSVVQKCLKKCSKFKLKSVGIPSIGAGTLNYPDDLVARCLLETTASYMEKNEGNTTLNQVIFVIFSSRSFQAFQSHLNTLYFKTTGSLDTSLFLSTHVAASSAGISETEDIAQPSQEDSDVYTVSLTAGHMLVVLKGDIADNDSNVIVNTTNEYLNLSRAGAVSAAILRKGGQVLQQACNSAMAKRKKLEEGEVEATEATGALKCHEVFHIFFKSGDDEMFIDTILACLQKAEKGKHQSIAFPAIGTGVSRYPPNRAANGMVEALQRFISSRPQHLRMIRVVLFQQELYEEFVEAFKGIGKETVGWTAPFSLVYSQVKAGAKAFKSLVLSASKPSLEDEELQDAMTQDWEIVQPESFEADLSVDKDSVVFTIFGEMEGDVKQAEKRIQEVLSKQFVSEKIEDPIIGQLEQQVVDRLEKEASRWQVHIDIYTDPELPMINLHGCLAAVLTVKDKIRDILSDRRHEKTLGAAANAVHQRIKWTRQLSDDDDEYDVMVNYDIEEAYTQKKPIFTCEEDRFFIDFRTMQETDIDSGLVVKVKRIDLAEAEKPADWEPMPIDQKTGKEVHVHLVDLKVGTPEYCRVENQFTATVVAGTNFSQLVSIQRVQNSILYGQYLARKKQMDKHNPKSIQNERWLFHGTSADTCAKINSQGFNRVFNGKHGVLYGKGVYFARDASYSTRYAPADSEGKKRMYLSRVLTGEYTVGNDQIMVPPPKNPQLDKTVIYDSTVDTMNNPSIFVVFNDAQTYPAYIITYK